MQFRQASAVFADFAKKRLLLLYSRCTFDCTLSCTQNVHLLPERFSTGGCAARLNAAAGSSALSTLIAVFCLFSLLLPPLAAPHASCTILNLSPSTRTIVAYTFLCLLFRMIILRSEVFMIWRSHQRMLLAVTIPVGLGCVLLALWYSVLNSSSVGFCLWIPLVRYLEKSLLLLFTAFELFCFVCFCFA